MGTEDKKHIWIVAAGTGGHIYPGLTIAEEIKKEYPTASLLFFGTRKRLESKLIPEHKFPLKFISSLRWKGRSFFKRILSLFVVSFGFMQAALEGLVRRPHTLLSVGGYVSVPVGLACSFLRIPIFILEPNIKSGIANQFISRFSKGAFSFEESDCNTRFHCPVHNTGIPVRGNISSVELKPHVTKILVMGGSQGARSLCQATIDIAKRLKNESKEIIVILQTGANNYDYAQEEIRKNQLEEIVRPTPYIEHISRVFNEVDVVISRAGAMSIGELSQTGLPTIFVPFPHAADNHQFLNAVRVRDKGAALLVTEDQLNFSQALFDALYALSWAADQYHKRQSLSTHFRKLSHPEAAREIVAHLI